MGQLDFFRNSLLHMSLHIRNLEKWDFHMASDFNDIFTLNNQNKLCITKIYAWFSNFDINLSYEFSLYFQFSKV